jgi:hypothetical protein
MNNVAAQCSLSATGAIPPNTGSGLRLGLTNECNLTCTFRSRDPDAQDGLSL